MMSASCRLPATTGPSPAAQPPAYAQALLAEHNRYRAEVGAPALVWDDQLAAYSQQWANQLAEQRKGTIAHRSGRDRAKDYGENLAYRWWSSTRPSGYTTQAVVKQWGDEKKFFRSGRNFDKCCVGGNCGHYTQMIWAQTQKVGCGMVEYPHKGGMAEVWVCNYDPPGNWLDQNPLAK
jgi:pathogenesis-related protein 1